MRKLSLFVVVFLFVGGCSCGKAQRKDAVGNPIAASQDWSAGKANAKAATPSSGNTQLSETAMRAFGKQGLDKYLKCGVPPTLSPEAMKYVPPGFDPNRPVGQPKNDFPLEVTISPTKGDARTVVTISAIAAAQPNARMVMLARFFDGKDHGMVAAKIADVTGRVTFKGPIPNDAPVGIAKIYVSASTASQKSALATTDFTVTGPGCR